MATGGDGNSAAGQVGGEDGGFKSVHIGLPTRIVGVADDEDAGFGGLGADDEASGGLTN